MSLEIKPCAHHYTPIYPKVVEGEHKEGGFYAEFMCPDCEWISVGEGETPEIAYLKALKDWNRRYTPTCIMIFDNALVPWCRCSECGSPFNSLNSTMIWRGACYEYAYPRCAFCGSKVTGFEYKTQIY